MCIAEFPKDLKEAQDIYIYQQIFRVTAYLYAWTSMSYVTFLNKVMPSGFYFIVNVILQ